MLKADIKIDLKEIKKNDNKSKSISLNKYPGKNSSNEFLFNDSIDFNNDFQDNNSIFKTNFLNLNEVKEIETEEMNVFDDFNIVIQQESECSNQEQLKKNESFNENCVFLEEEFNDINKISAEIKELNNLSSNLFSSKPGQLNQKFLHKKKYNILSPSDKQKAVELAKIKGIKIIANQYNISHKSLKRWMTSGILRKKGGGRKEKDPQMEDLLYKWIQETIKKNDLNMTKNMIKQKALLLSENNDFVASKDWLKKFIKKYNIMFQSSLDSEI